MIALLGASGQLGSAFVGLLGDTCLPVTRNELDLVNTSTITPWIAAHRPELVINCAAYTDVDAAESDMGTAMAVNAIAVGELSAACRDIGAGFVTFSTDYVFDGSKEGPYVESDAPHPLNAYGTTKLEGERSALAANPSALVVRTSWLFSSSHPNFVTTILNLLTIGEVSVVDDQKGRPTFVDDLAERTLRLLETGASGVLHLTNRGETSRWNLAREIAVLADFDPDLVQAVSSSEASRPARRPHNSVLDSERLGELRLPELADYHRALEETVRTALSPRSRSSPR